MGGGADTVDIAAHEMRHTRVLQARHHRPGRGVEPLGETAPGHLGKLRLQLPERHITARHEQCAHDDEHGE